MRGRVIPAKVPVIIERRYRFWQPIVSAPKTRILACLAPADAEQPPTGDDVVIARWSPAENCWLDTAPGPIRQIYPTMWSPIPVFDEEEP